jgi:hypothetical protein
LVVAAATGRWGRSGNRTSTYRILGVIRRIEHADAF